MIVWTGRGSRVALAVGTTLVASIAADRAGAQAWNYPSFQQPIIANREFNFAVAYGGDGGGDFLAQWREGLDDRNQIEVEGGLVSPTHSNLRAILGAQYAFQLTRETPDLPIDVLLTAGVFDAFGDGNFFRLPIGVSVGHRFPFGRGLAVTPYVHPRLSFDASNCCDKVGLEFDLGANLEVTPQLAVRISGTFGGSDAGPNDPGFGLGVAWTPRGLRGAAR